MSTLRSYSGDASEVSSRYLDQVSRTQQDVELAIFVRAVLARYRADTDRLDSQALADALQAALEDAVGLLEHGLKLAAGNPYAVDLVTEAVELLSAMNRQRIVRRFEA